MRKITFVTVASMVLFVFNATAQITKGAAFLGGSLGVTNSKSETTVGVNDYKDKTTSWFFSPQIGRAVGENKIAGIFLQISGSNVDANLFTNPYNKEKTSGFGGGFFYRFYVPLNKRFFVLGETALGANSSSQERKTDAKLYSENKTTAISLSAVPGIAFRATKSLYLETSLSNLLVLSYYSSKTDFYDQSAGSVYQTNKVRQFNASANTSGFSNIAIGIRWIFPAKK